MRHRITPLLLFAAFACAGDSTTAPQAGDLAFDRIDGAPAGGRGLMVELSPDQEVPPVFNSQGSGTFHMTLNPGRAELCYVLTAQDLLAPAAAAHIHRAPAGVAGPVVVPLTAPTAGSSTGCVTIDGELLREIWNAPEQFYVNVHTPAHPPGEIRAQLHW